MVDEIETIRDRIVRPKYPGITIGRVPQDTYDKFKLLSAEYCEDYGLTLKFLIDFYFGLFPTGLEGIESDIEQMKGEIALLKEKIQEKKEDKPVKKRLDGSIRQ